MIKLLGFLSLSLLSGCAIVSIEDKSRGPNGNILFEISCNGIGSELGPCYSKAGKACQEAGYKVINQYSAAPFYNLVVECSK